MIDSTPPAAAGEVVLRDVTDDDLPIFFEFQRDPEANRMAAFPARDQTEFTAFWKRILGDDTVVTRTITVDDVVVGNIVSWEQDGEFDVGYWIGRDYWGRGIASRALAVFLNLEQRRPLHAHVATHNVGSIRVLVKCGLEHPGTVQVADDGVEEYRLELRA